MSAPSIIDLAWTGPYSHYRAYVIDPETTEVAAVAKEARKVFEAYAAFQAKDRERDAQRRVVAGAGDAAKASARVAGHEDRPIKAKEIRRQLAAEAEKFEEIDLEWEHLSSKLASRHTNYLDAVTHHAPALRHEMKSSLDSAILTLASAAASARRASAAIAAATGGLGALVTPGDPRPRPILAPQPEFGDAGSPSIHADLGIDELGKAVNYAMQVLDKVTADEKLAKMQAESDAAVSVEPLEDEDDDE